MVARLTPDQKAACSNHIGVDNIFIIRYMVNIWILKLSILHLCIDGSSKPRPVWSDLIQLARGTAYFFILDAELIQ